MLYYKKVVVATMTSLLLATLGAANAQEASESTRNANRALFDYLPFDDQTDIENARRGFIAQIEGGKIFLPDGQVSYDATQFEFIQGDAPDTVNPSFWRQSTLNAMHGLYEVVPGIYQFRGYDLANMSFIRG